MSWSKRFDEPIMLEDGTTHLLQQLHYRASAATTPAGFARTIPLSHGPGLTPAAASLCSAVRFRCSQRVPRQNRFQYHKRVVRRCLFERKRLLRRLQRARNAFKHMSERFSDPDRRRLAGPVCLCQCIIDFRVLLWRVGTRNPDLLFSCR